MTVDLYWEKVVKEYDFALLLVRIYDILQNISDSTIENLPTLKSKENFDLFFNNFKTFSKISLDDYRNAMYKKVGYSLVDFKGKFGKIWIILVYADKTTKELMFEEEKLVESNFFSYLTEHSQFLFRKWLDRNNDYGDVFGLMMNKPQKTHKLHFSIEIASNKGLNHYADNPIKAMEEKILDTLNNSKTLFGRFSPILVQSSNSGPQALILLECKIAKKRHNFDQYIWNKVFE